MATRDTCDCQQGDSRRAWHPRNLARTWFGKLRLAPKRTILDTGLHDVTKPESLICKTVNGHVCVTVLI
ncbi:hypothetical protein DPMN_005655 [Dreissena polymorpha]|uniref:Uncharacterized protein n=1 Tax=Dreissena polymorpha TaxID=45954 RepID=A0A9D4RWT8_DREPO|nr:hypothetical protein DPMN_005655 [Dreissena polymorpha]